MIMKKEIRKKYIEIRKRLENKKEKSKNIAEQIINHSKYIQANVVACYCSLKDEVCLDDVICDALKNGKVVVVPKVNGDTIDFYEIKSMNELVVQSFGIREPIHERVFDKNKIEFILVPGVSFDLDGNRMGFGKGYYDRYLFDLEVYKIGVCFREQINEKIPVDTYDIKMDEVIVG